MNKNFRKSFKIRHSQHLQRKLSLEELQSSEMKVLPIEPNEWWLANNLKNNTGLFARNEQKIFLEEGNFFKKGNSPDLDQHVLNSCVRPELGTTDIIPPKAANDALKTPRLAITVETMNHEFNREIMVNQIRKKFKGRMTNNTKIKAISGDLTRSFKCLSGFHHMNITALDEIQTERVIEAKPLVRVKSKTKIVAELRSFESLLKEKFQEINTHIKQRKEVLMENQIKMQKYKILVERKKSELFALEANMVVKEAELNKSRLLGQISISDGYKHIVEYQNTILMEKANLEQILNFGSSEHHKSKTIIVECEEEIHLLNFKRLMFRMKMKEFYLDLLKNEDRLIELNWSVFYVIDQLMSIKEIVSDKSFSDFFDCEDIKFIREYHDLKARIEEQKKSYSSTISQFRDSMIKTSRAILAESQEERIKEAISVVRSLKLQSSFTQTFKENLQAAAPVQNSNAKITIGHMAGDLRLMKEKQLSRIFKKSKAFTTKSDQLADSNFIQKSIALYFRPSEINDILPKIIRESKVSVVFADL